MMRGPHKKKSLFIRFWAKVDKAGDDDCWLWTAGTVRGGYGQFWAKDGKRLATHVMWMLTYGDYPTKNISHTCDNPPCVNPAHLFEATQDENMQDMARKRRSRGRLTADQVRNIRIRARNGESATSIAKTEPIGQTNISAILRGETYRYVR